MGTTILGWLLIAIGLIATVAGVGGGIAMMFRELQREAKEDKSFGFVQLPTDLLKALTEFLNALIKAPVWLALIMIGFVLVAWGGSMI
jgi:hypothetical protein